MANEQTTELLTADEIAYDMGYDDALKGHYKTPYEDWTMPGSHFSYKAGYEDAERDNEADFFEDEEA